MKNTSKWRIKVPFSTALWQLRVIKAHQSLAINLALKRVRIVFQKANAYGASSPNVFEVTHVMRRVALSPVCPYMRSYSMYSAIISKEGSIAHAEAMTILSIITRNRQRHSALK